MVEEALTPSRVSDPASAPGSAATLRAVIDHKLRADGTYANGLELGLAESVVLQAALGNAAAQNAVVAAVKNARVRYTQARGIVRAFGGPVDLNEDVAAATGIRPIAPSAGV